jgi:hypothetical protein
VLKGFLMRNRGQNFVEFKTRQIKNKLFPNKIPVMSAHLKAEGHSSFFGGDRKVINPQVRTIKLATILFFCVIMKAT